MAFAVNYWPILSTTSNTRGDKLIIERYGNSFVYTNYVQVIARSVECFMASTG